MREFCLMSKAGNVINMSMRYAEGEPELTDYQREQGYYWLPVHKVPMAKLQAYRYWNERP